MKKLISLAVILAAVTLPAPVLAAGGPAELKVLARNQYLGAELTPLFTAATPQALVATTTGIFATVKATNFPERAEALADEIAGTNPHVVGLQEVELWRSQTPADFLPAPNAIHVEFDFLQLLLDALAARGLHYAPVAVVTNYDGEAPRATGTGLQDIRLTDRDAILARTDLPTTVFSVSAPHTGNFQTNFVLSSPVLGEFTVLRGWASADVTLRGRTVRVVTTHLEPYVPAVQVAQAEEILAGPAHTTLPVVLLGDLNSDADGSYTPTYANVLAAGFSDTWNDKPGFTCCQAETMSNPTSTLTRRIDFVLVRGAIKASTVQLVGDQAEDRTPSGLWPSDHAGVWAVLHVR